MFGKHSSLVGKYIAKAALVSSTISPRSLDCQKVPDISQRQHLEYDTAVGISQVLVDLWFGSL